ncbi:MAG: hypothetical protein WCI49_16420, partial [Ferruginibacter sp.]
TEEIAPGENADSVREVSFLLKDGKAARKSDIEKKSKKLWSCIEEKVKSEEVWEYYDFLKTNSDPENTSVGIKKGLFGSSTGYYIWFLFPVYDGNSKNFANAVAMEAMTLINPEGAAKSGGDTAGSADSGEGGSDGDDNSPTGLETGGRATYFFRIIDRARFAAEYKSSTGKQSGQLNDAIDSEYGDFIRKINSCMLAINFRREPIYFTDEQLKDNKNISYRYAVAMIPELAWLRDNFIGRIIHKDIGEWRNDFKELVAFNINSADNSVKFKKGVK